MEILWCATELNGPYNGVGMYQGEKVWFFRTEDGKVEVHRVSEELLSQAEENHSRYCEASGAPLRHGDPRKIKMATLKKREVPAGLDESEELEIKDQPITTPQKYTHVYNPLTVRGERLVVLDKGEVSNYYVEQCFEYVE